MGSSNCCDNCRQGVNLEDSEEVLQDFGSCAYQLMKAISAMDESFGITAPILFLRGSTSQRVPDRFRKHSLFGIGREISETWWKALSRELVAEKYLMETMGHTKFYTLCKLTPKGRSWLSEAEDERHRRLLLQPTKDLFSRVCVPWKKADPALVESTASDLKSDYTRRAKVSSGFDIHKMKPSRSVVRPTQIHRTCTPAVSAREIQLQSELYGKLVSERQKLAGLRDIPPALLATNKILLDMAKSRPCSISSLKQVDGVSEAKAAMLTPLIDVILAFCKTHNVQGDDSSSSTPPVQTESSCEYSSECQSLPDSVSVTYRLFQMEHMSMRQVADARSLPIAVVESHLLQAQKMGCAMDLYRAGLSESIYNTIKNIINSSPISSDMSDFKTIRSHVPEDVSSFLLRLALYELQREASFTAHHEFSWIEPLDKSAIANRPPVKHAIGESQHEADVMDMSEDDLFISIPMPQVTHICLSQIANYKDSCLSRDLVPQSSGMYLASWNQDNLDKDTQDLFSDSPVKIESQPTKRKLPDWAEGPSTSIPATTEKKAKKKKGLFI